MYYDSHLPSKNLVSLKDHGAIKVSKHHINFPVHTPAYWAAPHIIMCLDIQFNTVSRWAFESYQHFDDYRAPLNIMNS